MPASGLVIFDCDGVLVDSEPLVQRVEMALIADLGWPVTVEEMSDQHLGRSWPTIAANIERHLGRALPDDFRDRAVAATHACFRAELVAVAGVAATIDSLTAAGFATCVASSGAHERIRLTLGITRLLPRFDGRIFSSEDVAHGKPSPDLFLHAATRMGHPPSRCVVVEDSPTGVAAARAAQMAVIGYAGRTPEAQLADADVVLDDMADLGSSVASVLRAV